MKSAAEKLATAVKFKDEGNESFKKGATKDALAAYHKAYLYIRGLDGGSDLGGGMGAMMGMAAGNQAPLTDEQKSLMSKTNLQIFTNMAACHMKLEQYEKVVDDCTKAIKIDDKNVKAYFRRGQARLRLRDLERAEEDLRHAASLEPNDAAIPAELSKLKSAQAAAAAEEKRRFGGFLNRAIGANAAAPAPTPAPAAAPAEPPTLRTDGAL